MKRRIAAVLLASYVSGSLLTTGCAMEAGESEVADEDDSELGEVAEAKKSDALLAVSRSTLTTRPTGLLGSVPASATTKAQTGVETWELYGIYRESPGPATSAATLRWFATKDPTVPVAERNTKTYIQTAGVILVGTVGGKPKVNVVVRYHREEANPSMVVADFFTAFGVHPRVSTTLRANIVNKKVASYSLDRRLDDVSAAMFKYASADIKAALRARGTPAEWKINIGGAIVTAGTLITYASPGAPLGPALIITGAILGGYGNIEWMIDQYDTADTTKPPPPPTNPPPNFYPSFGQCSGVHVVRDPLGRTLFFTSPAEYTAAVKRDFIANQSGPGISHDVYLIYFNGNTADPRTRVDTYKNPNILINRQTFVINCSMTCNAGDELITPPGLSGSQLNFTNTRCKLGKINGGI